jgi:hypothetical protein
MQYLLNIYANVKIYPLQVISLKKPFKRKKHPGDVPGCVVMPK